MSASISARSGSNFGCIFRNGATSESHYHVLYKKRSGSWEAEWYRFAPFATIDNTSCEGLTSAVVNDWFMAMVEGTGNATEVKVWLKPTDPGDCDHTADSGWGTPDCTFTTDPGANAVDTGDAVGMRAFDKGTGQMDIDNFSGGDTR